MDKAKSQDGKLEEHGLEVAARYPDGRPMVRTCIHARCKSMYYSGVERPGLLHLSDGLTYWCNHTQHEVGLDGKECNPETCQPGRDCFEK